VINSVPITSEWLQTEEYINFTQNGTVDYLALTVQAKSFKVDIIEDVALFGSPEFFAALSSAFTGATILIGVFFPLDYSTRHFIFGDRGIPEKLRAKQTVSRSDQDPASLRESESKSPKASSSEMRGTQTPAVRFQLPEKIPLKVDGEQRDE